MTTSVLPDPTTPYGERVQRRLRDEQLIWLTTVDRTGTPQPNPVWFLWDGESFLVYNRPDAHRLVHVRQRPSVSLNLNSIGDGNIVVVTGRAELVDGVPLPNENPEYVSKYGDEMIRVSGGHQTFGEEYPVPLRVWPRRVRGF